MRWSGISTRIAIVLFFAASTTLAGPAASFVDLPTLTMDPFSAAPLTAQINFTTDIDSQALLRVTDGIELWTVKFPDLNQTHSLPLFGLKPNRTYSVEVTLIPGGATDSSQTAVTGPLPDPFPGLTTIYTDPAAMEPGYTLIDSVNYGRTDPRERYVIIVDRLGDVVWYSPSIATSVEQLPNGELTFRVSGATGPGSQDVVEMDLFGRQTSSIPLLDPYSGLHHELFRTSAGTYLSLSRKEVEIVDFPSSEEDPAAPPATAGVRDEPIVEFAADGTLLNEWSLLDMIDPLRIGYGSLNSTTAGFDWVHTNAVIQDPNDGSIIVSVRHQDAVVKFAPATGELIWILGPPENWTTTYQPFLLNPVGAPFTWQYHQHAPLVSPNNTLMLFDNGNYRASPFDGTTPFEALYPLDNYSRAVEYRIDETTMEVEQIWEYGPDIDEVLYANFVGDVDWMETTGNVLITYGGTRVMGGVSNPDAGFGGVTARLIEVDHQQPANKVFDLLVFDPQAIQAMVYRSERIGSLYAPGVMVTSLGPIAVGAVPDGGDIPGTPLTLGKDETGDVTLAWGKSCVSSDLDYAIYEGALGDFGNHTSTLCSTGGATSQTLTPLAGDRYYLVVPMNGSEEGSYGTSGAGVERPTAVASCLPQALATCP